MIGRSVILLFLAAGFCIPCLATWWEPPCVDAIPYQTYLSKGSDVRKYELITTGKDENKYKPVFFVEVTFPGRCQGKYANPCSTIEAGREQKKQVSPEVCKELAALYRLKEFKPQQALTRAEYLKLPPAEQAKFVQITEGPDAFKVAYKPKYYVRVDKPKEPPKRDPDSQLLYGFYAPPNGHCGDDTVSCDPWLSTWLARLTKKSR